MAESILSPLLVDKKIYRGRAPESDSDWNALKDLGITDILDLRSQTKILGDGGHPLLEQIAADNRGMRVWFSPMSEIGFPEAQQLRFNCDLICLKADSGLYVHCEQGVDRTGIQIAHYRIYEQRWSKDQAVAEMHARGMHKWYYPWEIVL